MDISKEELQILLEGYWKLPEEHDTQQQMQCAALICMAVESYPEWGSVLVESVQASTEAPGFVMKAGFLKRGLSDDEEFEKWIDGALKIAKGGE